MTDSLDPTERERDDRRKPVAAFWLLLGAVCMLTSVYLYRQRSEELPSPPPPRAAETPAEPEPLAAAEPVPPNHQNRQSKLIKRILFYSGLLFLVFMVAALALTRWSRAYRAMLLRRGVKPTPTTDIWKMHRLPPDAQDPDG